LGTASGWKYRIENEGTSTYFRRGNRLSNETGNKFWSWSYLANVPSWLTRVCHEQMNIGLRTCIFQRAPNFCIVRSSFSSSIA
jgi:hypothetical protein